MWAKILFILWFFLISVPLSMLMGGHHLSLKSSKDQSLLALVDKKTNDWKVLHFLNPECGCSQNVVNSLLKRVPKTDRVSEKVIILGQNETWVKELSRAGFEVAQGKMDEFAIDYKITAVPQLVIIKQEKIFYSGGYSSKRGPATLVEDEMIFQEIVLKNESKERPIYGCVNGSENQSKVDLIGAKYKRKL